MVIFYSYLSHYQRVDPEHYPIYSGRQWTRVFQPNGRAYVDLLEGSLWGHAVQM